MDYLPFDAEVTDDSVPDLALDDATTDGGQTIDSEANNGTTVEEKIDIAVKTEIKTEVAESMEVAEEEWEVPSGRRTVRKRRTKGGRAFLKTTETGGPPTLRITTT